MYLNGVWINGILILAMSLLTLICAIYAFKKMNWKPHEFMFVVVSVVLLVVGCVNTSYAINPEVETIKVNFNYQKGNSVIFEREYFFFDENGESYRLTMDLITARKLLPNITNNEFEKEQTYIIKYEKKSNVIVYIDETIN